MTVTNIFRKKDFLAWFIYSKSTKGVLMKLWTGEPLWGQGSTEITHCLNELGCEDAILYLPLRGSSDLRKPPWAPWLG